VSQDVGRDRVDQLLDHSYDGIQEYDNRLPNWWLHTLYWAIVFAFGYWIFYHVLGIGHSKLETHAMEVAEASRAQLARMGDQEVTDESLTLLSTVPERINAGREVFQQFCVVCHGSQGEGNVGPNLTDGYWIHGGKPTDILATVTNGVPEKGMASWIGQLGPTRVQNVVAFVLTLKNTNVPGKAPEGEPAPPEGDQASLVSGR